MRPARVFVLLILVSIALALGTLSNPRQPALAAKDTETPTPTLDPALPTESPLPPTPVPTDTPRITSTPWIVIFITPTPDKKAPSLQIVDLDKKLKKALAAHANLDLSSQAWIAPLNSPVPPEVDQIIDAWFDWLIQRQVEYYRWTGKFCQMLPSHYTIPADGVHLYPDGWFAHPTDQQFAWPDLNAIQFEPIPFSITIDVYAGTEGIGFVACYRMLISGQLLSRCQGLGPESLRYHGWQPEAIP